MWAVKNRVGERVGRLVVLDFGGYYHYGNGRRRAQWRCRCDCGNVRTVMSNNLRVGHTEGCGCLQRDNVAARRRTHGHKSHGRTSREYVTYRGMLARCYSTKATSYARYGGKGITVCDRWRQSFENFVADMGQRPENCSLDRIDPTGQYAPENCRWASAADQSSNTRRNVHADVGGQRLTIKEIATRYRLPYWTVMRRHRAGTLAEYLAHR